MTRLALAALMCTLLSPLPVVAETTTPTAYAAVRTALEAIWDELPLSVGTATLTEAPAAGYGDYEARPDNRVTAGEMVNVYAELIGYGFADNGDGTFSRKLAADLTLLDAAGSVRASAREFFTSDVRSRHKPLETYVSFTATLAEFEPGTYTLRYDVRDLVDGESTQFELPVELVAAGGV